MLEKESAFRKWLQEMYYENCDEHEMFNLKRYSLGEYFQKYKYWLKREFRHQQRVDQ